MSDGYQLTYAPATVPSYIKLPTLGCSIPEENSLSHAIKLRKLRYDILKNVAIPVGVTKQENCDMKSIEDKHHDMRFKMDGDGRSGSNSVVSVPEVDNALGTSNGGLTYVDVPSSARRVPFPSHAPSPPIFLHRQSRVRKNSQIPIYWFSYSGSEQLLDPPDVICQNVETGDFLLYHKDKSVTVWICLSVESGEPRWMRMKEGQEDPIGGHGPLVFAITPATREPTWVRLSTVAKFAKRK